MKVLAIDHGTTSGYAVMDNKKLTSYGLLQIKGDTVGDKLLDFSCRVTDLITLFNPDVIAVEIPSHDRNAKTNLLLIGFYTQILLLASFHSVDLFPIHPTSLKKELTNNGRADKYEVAVTVCEENNLNYKEIVPCEYYQRGSQKGKPRPKTEKYDITDAIGLAMFANRRYKDGSKYE